MSQSGRQSSLQQDMQAAVTRLTRTCSPRSREIIREILQASHPTPLSTQEIYRRVLKEYPHEKSPTPFSPPNPPFLVSSDIPRTKRNKKLDQWKPPPAPPHPEHPIRSLKYLKVVVMEDMAQRNEALKVHSMREPTSEELARKNDSKAQKKKKKSASEPQVVLNVKGMIDQWGWILKTADQLEVEKQDRSRIRKAVEGLKMQDTKKVERAEHKAFQEEWGHLNPRRQRARVEKLAREAEWSSIVDRGRQEGKAEAERTAAQVQP